MRLYGPSELREAVAHASEGGQALHRHRFLCAGAPACFVRDVRAGLHIGHLFDQDRGRLRRTARRLGVRVVVIGHAGTPRQHVDLCGAPMRRAVEECAETQRRGDLTFLEERRR